MAFKSMPRVLAFQDAKAWRRLTMESRRW